MWIHPAEVSKRTLYGHMTRLITPRPIAWVSTISNDGVLNLAPYSYFNAVGTRPPTLMFCPANRADGTKKDTLCNIEQSGEFVVNVVPHSLAQAMSDTSGEYAPDVDEFASCDLESAPSQSVDPPRVAQALAAFECRLHTAMGLGTGPGGANLVIGNILAIYVEDACLDENGQVDPVKIDTIGRMGGDGYSTTRDRFEIERPQRSPRPQR